MGAGVFHARATAGIWGRYAAYYQPNVRGSQHVLAACREHGVERLVFTSSPSVVFGGRSMEGVNESAPYPRKHQSPYSATKALAGIAAVAAVQSKLLGDGWHRLTVVARADASDLGETISRTIASVGGVVRELRRDIPSLEQLFMRMIGEADRGATPSPRGNGS